jgi:formate-dependent phosphoribosylglycinamide formyltransferase (GAR transformylase)
MSTPVFGANPRPDTRIRLVGGPVFFERVIEGVALARAQSSMQVADKKARNFID